MGFNLRLLFSVYNIFLLMQFGSLVALKPKVPCYFIFGDSLVDSGNNNELVTTAKANYPPYGIDFPDGATGRFTNGRTIADIIGEFLCFEEFIPPFATAKNHEIHRGVNYASGGAGILEESGRQLGDLIPLDRQLVNHQAVVSRLSGLQGNASFTQEYLSKCIYIVNVGSNDYLQNYLKPNFYNSSSQYNPDQYATLLSQKYSQQLMTLYKMGARKIAIFGLAQIGCTPWAITTFDTKGCADKVNNVIKLFNDKLKPLVDDFNNNLVDSKFTFINITNVSQAGSLLPSIPCCKVRADGQCSENTSPCVIRKVHPYFDNLHPSSISTLAIATRAFVAISPLDACPFDISHLASL